MSPAAPGAGGDLAGVVLAAGRGSRMRPLTDRVPKPLLTVGDRSLLELALARVAALTPSLAVNAHHLAGQIDEAARALHPGVHVSHEREALLGTAGALHRLRDWIGGRPVVVANSDMWLARPVPNALLEGWDGRRVRLLTEDVGRPADFGTHRYMGVCLLPGPVAAALTGEPSGLYAAVWRDAAAAGELDLVPAAGGGFDCGTAAEFVTANLQATGRRAVVAPDAEVEGTVDLAVVLAGGRVTAGEHLVAAVRDRWGQTLPADPAAIEVPAAAG
ncbi:NTP transferase domain-containing protein [Nakamurella endophytica]|uniref:MobA-like NTP transferase domain-containing protein n=1 Tax=Nakamurella endophytica TaxID=1748367 RepID=A0A917SLG9_9ACTN|nr:NTP transferase domain-containing protein [Nakamurella endophytica]GGL88010.1 hypothetical protein GCM10011594_04550 [Nakamurella endophytica]